MITLMDHGTVPNDDRTKFFEWLEEDSAEMHKVVADLYVNSASILNSAGKAHLIDDNVIVLNLEGADLYDLRMNIYDAVSAMQM